MLHNSGNPLVVGKPVAQGGGPKYPVLQVGIASWLWGVPADPRYCLHMCQLHC